LLHCVGTNGCNSASWNDILGNVIPSYVYELSRAKLIDIGIGVIGADMSNVVANMFATSNVSKEFQSISVAIVVTMLSLSQTIGQSITSALITSKPLFLLPNERHWREWFKWNCSCNTISQGLPRCILVRFRSFRYRCMFSDDFEVGYSGTQGRT
jgi:hypothetical protein